MEKRRRPDLVLYALGGLHGVNSGPGRGEARLHEGGVQQQLLDHVVDDGTVVSVVRPARTQDGLAEIVHEGVE